MSSIEYLLEVCNQQAKMSDNLSTTTASDLSTLPVSSSPTKEDEECVDVTPRPVTRTQAQQQPKRQLTPKPSAISPFGAGFIESVYEAMRYNWGTYKFLHNNTKRQKFAAAFKVACNTNLPDEYLSEAIGFVWDLFSYLGKTGVLDPSKYHPCSDQQGNLYFTINSTKVHVNVRVKPSDTYLVPNQVPPPYNYLDLSRCPLYSNDNQGPKIATRSDAAAATTQKRVTLILPPRQQETVLSQISSISLAVENLEKRVREDGDPVEAALKKQRTAEANLEVVQKESDLALEKSNSEKAALQHKLNKAQTLIMEARNRMQNLQENVETAVAAEKNFHVAISTMRERMTTSEIEARLSESENTLLTAKVAELEKKLAQSTEVRPEVCPHYHDELEAKLKKTQEELEAKTAKLASVLSAIS